MANEKPTQVKIKYGSHTFYESSKTKKSDAYQEFKYTDRETKQEKVVYHRDLEYISGELMYVGMQDFEKGGKFLSIIIKGENESFGISIPVYSASGVKTTDNYFNSMVGILENLSKGDYVNLTVNTRSKDKKGEYYRNVVALDKDNKIIKSKFDFKDVPKWNKEETEDDFGKTTVKWDASPTNKFYIEKFMQILEDFKGSSSNSSSDSEQKTDDSAGESAGESQGNSEDMGSGDEYDDLPF